MSGQPRGASKKRQIAQDLLELITSGKVRPGERLPTEVQLAERYGVTRPTIREAYRLLIAGRWVVSLGLSGYFVRDRRTIRWDLSGDGCLDPWDALSGPLAERRGEQVVAVEMMTGRTPLPGGPLADFFETGAGGGGDYVCRLVIRTIANLPVQVAATYVPLDVATGTPLCRPEPLGGGVLGVLGQRLGPPARWVDEVTGRASTGRESDLLEVGELAPVLEATRRVRWSPGGAVLMVERLVVNAGEGVFVSSSGISG